MSAAPWAAHFGLSRTPFGKSIPADIGNHRYPNVLNDHLRDTCAA